MQRTRYWSSAVPAFLVIGLMLFSLSKEISAQTYYTATDLGRIDSTSAYDTTPRAVNSSGQVVGHMGARNSSGSYYKAFLWQNGVLTDIGGVPGGLSAFAYDINDAGQIVGMGEAPGDPPHALWWHDGTLTDLHPVLMQTEQISTLPSLENKMSDAIKINNAGQILCRVTGTIRLPSGRTQSFAQAFIYSNGIVTAVTLPNEIPAANECCAPQFQDFNNLGQVVGSFLKGSGWSGSFVWDNGTTTILDYPAGWPSSQGSLINDTGQVVGTLYNGVSGSTFLYENGIIQEIGIKNSVYDITNSGVIIGIDQVLSTYSGALELHPFLYRDGVGTDVNDILEQQTFSPIGSWYMRSCTDINEQMQLVCLAQQRSNVNFHTRAFLLTPIVDTDAPQLNNFYDQHVNGTSPAGAVVSFNVSVVDNLDRRPAVTLSQQSGTLFPIGTTTVTATARDASGNTTVRTINVTVSCEHSFDPSPLVDITVNATSAAGAVVSYANIGGVASVQFSIPSGSTFPIGTTNVNYVVTELCGNTIPGSFQVHVVDAPPVLSLPSTIHVTNTTSNSGKVVSYSVSATDVVSGTVPVDCDYSSGSTFPVGDTVVTCNGTDGGGNTTSGSFIVEVSSCVGCTLPTFEVPKTSQLAYVSSTGNSLAVGDFNNDGKPDLAETGGAASSMPIAVYLNDGSGGFGTPVSIITPNYGTADAIATADFNNDGNLDLVAGTNDALTVIHGDGTGHFGAQYAIGTNAINFSLDVEVGDFNHDHKPDVFVTGFYGGKQVFLGDGFALDPNPAFQEDGCCDQSNNGVAVADLDGDGNQDVLSEPNLILGDGMGNFVARATTVTRDYAPPFSHAYAVGDFNGDGKPDVATPTVSIYLGHGAGGFAPGVYYQVLPLALGYQAWDVKTADINGDGKLDLITAGADQVFILLGPFDGRFVSITSFPGTTTDFPTRLAIADFNGDGKPDIAEMGGTDVDPQLKIFLNSTQQTPVGANSTVVVNNTAFTFDNVATGGTTSVTPIDPASVGQVPGGFAVSDSVAYEIATTATFTGSVTLAFKVPGPISQADFNNLAILHNVNGTLVDVTASSPQRDYSNLTVYATTTSFSPFYLARKGPHIKSLFDQTKAYKSGSTIPIKLQLQNASNANVSSASTSLVARDLRLTSNNTTAPVIDSGNANPDYTFRYDATLGGAGGGYIYNLSTKGLRSGQYVLSFYAGSDHSFFYTAKFEVK